MPLLPEQVIAANTAISDAFDVLRASQHLRSYYSPPVEDRRSIQSLLVKIWEHEVEDEVFDDMIDESEICAMMSYIAADQLLYPHLYTRAAYFYAPWNYVHCDGCDRMVNGDNVCAHCDECEGCCSCVSCPSCGDHIDRDNDGICDLCGDCDSCCSCHTCSECDCRTRDSRWCSDCERCTRCGCDCSNGDLQERTEGRPWPAVSSFERRKNRLTRMLGVEWEINSCEDPEPLHAWAYKWRGGIHEDGSCGHEMVTAPIAGDHVVDCLSDLGKALSEADAAADDRCGIHVHVEARDLMWDDMFRLLGVYSHLEPLLFAIAGQNRQKNHYCSPAASAFENALASIDRKGAVLALIYKNSPGYDPTPPSDARSRFRRQDSDGNRQSVHKKSDGRYRALNIVPWLARHRNGKERVKDCTVEFRLHRNTLDGARVLGWALLCARIVDWSAKASDAEAARVAKMTALHALAVIAPESMTWVLDRLRDWRRATTYRRGVPRTVRFREGAWTCVG